MTTGTLQLKSARCLSWLVTQSRELSPNGRMDRAGFFSRNAMHKRGLCRRVVSVSRSSKREKYPQTFSPSGTSTILVFRTRRYCKISTGTVLLKAAPAAPAAPAPTNDIAVRLKHLLQ